VAAKATTDLGLTEIIEEALVCPLERDEELPEVVEVVVAKASKRPQTIILQLYKWHAISAIKWRLVAIGRYLKDRRNEIILMI
jgi:hypothetical protein